MQWWPAILLACVLVLMAVLSGPPGRRIIERRQVRRVDLDPTLLVNDTWLQLLSEPLLLPASRIAQRLVASSHWTPDALTAALRAHRVPHASHSTLGSLFLYEDASKPMASTVRWMGAPASLRPWRWTPTSHLASLPFPRLVHRMRAGIPTYVSKDLAVLPSTLRQRLQATLREADAVDLADNDAVTWHLWMGRNTTATLHYDAVINMYFMLHGSKTFRLLPPACACQSQDLVPATDLEARNGLVAHLKAGDLLIVPSFWLHHVHAHDNATSVALSAWHVSNADRFYATRIMRLPIPVNETMTLRQRARHLGSFISAVVGSLHPNVTASHFFARMRAQRWSPLLPRLDSITDYADPLCPKLAHGAHEAVNATVGFESYVDPVVEAFVSLSVPDPAVAELYLTDWVEEVTTLVLGLANVPRFLLRCL